MNCVSARKIAAEAGQKIFIGNPCKRCDNTERYTSNGDCVKCASFRNKSWMVKNSAERKNYERTYKLSNAEYIKTYEKKHGLRSRIAMNCRLTKLNRIVKWDTELTNFVSKEAHELARMRDELTGIKWSVDHIVPIKGKKVSGLHTWNNMQVIPMHLNRLKGSNFEV